MDLADIFEPTEDRVLVKRDAEAEMFGRIYIPENAQELAFRGTVVKVGPGKYNPQHDKYEPMYIKPGMRVVLHKHLGIKIDPDRDDLWVCRQTDFYGWVRE